VAKAMMGLGKEIELVQRHKAEADVAVAAASILARDEFVKRLGTMERLYGLKFPKGASAAVEEAGREYVKKFGDEKLGQVAKMHFRTSYRVLGLPEPAKVEWRKPGKSAIQEGE
jgi:ribonuclease HIII